MAEIGEIVQVAIGKGAAHLHGRKHRAQPLAIAAGVADGHQAVGFGEDPGSVHRLYGFLLRLLPSSQFWIRAATSRLFLSIIIMCELPWIPALGRSTTSTLPPAAFIASAKATPVARIFGQRESRSM